MVEVTCQIQKYWERASKQYGFLQISLLYLRLGSFSYFLKDVKLMMELTSQIQKYWKPASNKLAVVMIQGFSYLMIDVKSVMGMR